MSRAIYKRNQDIPKIQSGMVIYDITSGCYWWVGAANPDHSDDFKVYNMLSSCCSSTNVRINDLNNCWIGTVWSTMRDFMLDVRDGKIDLK